MLAICSIAKIPMTVSTALAKASGVQVLESDDVRHRGMYSRCRGTFQTAPASRLLTRQFPIFGDDDEPRSFV